MRLRGTKSYLQPNNTDFYYLCFGFVGIFVLWGLIIKFPILFIILCGGLVGLTLFATVKTMWLSQIFKPRYRGSIK